MEGWGVGGLARAGGARSARVIVELVVVVVVEVVVGGIGRAWWMRRDDRRRRWVVGGGVARYRAPRTSHHPTPPHPNPHTPTHHTHDAQPTRSAHLAHPRTFPPALATFRVELQPALGVAGRVVIR